MASQSALLAGFAYGGLSVSISDKISTFVTFGYLASTTTAMGCGLLCITIAAFCVMFGPGLALRGGDGAASMHKAVDNMKNESTQCFIFFILQLLFFHISSFLLMWLYYSATVAFIINLILGGFLVVFIMNGKDIFDKLYVKEEEAVSGKFKDFNQYENMADLDNNQRTNRGSPEGRRGRSGSDDYNQRMSNAKVRNEFQQNLQQQSITPQNIVGGVGAPGGGQSDNPFEIKNLARMQTFNQVHNQGNNMILNAFRKVLKPQ